MKLTRKLTALAMAVLLAFTLTACSPKAWAQDTVVKLVGDGAGRGVRG